jgi:hypothetical protein
VLGEVTKKHGIDGQPLRQVASDRRDDALTLTVTWRGHVDA